MKKQLVLGLCTLVLTSCALAPEGQRDYSTLADMFVWGNNVEKDQNQPVGVTVSYKEQFYDNSQNAQSVKYNNYKYNDDVEVKYVDVIKTTEDTDKVKTDDIIIKEVVIEAENPDQNTQTYTLVKRSERYKKIEDTFSPNVYAIMASRVTNNFLTEIPAFFADKPNSSLYIEETVYADRYMPATPDIIGATTKEIIIGSNMIPVLDNQNDATHILKGRVSNINTPEIPVFKYEIGLYDKENKLIDKWSDTIRQVQNDDGSWW